MTDNQTARRLIGSLDLTSLNRDDTEAKIAALCQKPAPLTDIPLPFASIRNGLVLPKSS